MKMFTLLAVLASISLGFLPATVRAEGIVTAELVGTRLIISGDGNHNQITIAGDVSSVTVSGDVDASFFPGDLTAIEISAGGGWDQVTVGGVISGDLRISTGAGQDWVAISATIIGNVDIETGQDSDEVRFWFADILGHTRISTGQGLDSVRFGGINSFAGDVAINTGVNNDKLLFGLYSLVEIGGNLEVSFGQGDDDLFFDVRFFSPEFALIVYGDASLHGDQGRNEIYTSGFPLEALIDVVGQFDLTGF